MEIVGQVWRLSRLYCFMSWLPAWKTIKSSLSTNGADIGWTGTRRLLEFELTMYCCILTLTLTFQPQNHVTSRISQGHSPYTKFAHFGIIHFWVMLRTNRQTDSQTDCLERPNHADRQSQLHIPDNNQCCVCLYVSRRHTVDYRSGSTCYGCELWCTLHGKKGRRLSVSNHKSPIKTAVFCIHTSSLTWQCMLL